MKRNKRFAREEGGLVIETRYPIKFVLNFRMAADQLPKAVHVLE
jgi:hypothetical protein